MISRQNYRAIFNIFGIKNVAKILQNVPEHQYLETLHSILFETKTRIKNPVGGCIVRIVSLEQKLKELQSQVTALEARLDGGSSSADPYSITAPSKGYLKLFM